MQVEIDICSSCCLSLFEIISLVKILLQKAILKYANNPISGSFCENYSCPSLYFNERNGAKFVYIRPR